MGYSDPDYSFTGGNLIRCWFAAGAYTRATLAKIERNFKAANASKIVENNATNFSTCGKRNLVKLQPNMMPTLFAKSSTEDEC